MHICLMWLLVSVLLIGEPTLQAQSSTEHLSGKPPLYTSVTGSIKDSGMENPQYVLSFIPIQKLMLEAVKHPLTKEAIEKAIQGTPVTLSHLLHLELLRQEQDTYRLNYLLLNVEDQETIYRIAARYGEDMAEAFLNHKSEFDHLLSRYQNIGLRSQLTFCLIAGAALNWGGLDLTTELGFRVKPPQHANGGVYFVHSAESGARLDLTGLYMDSQTAPGSKMSFSTFGDGPSLPRLQGLPDVFDGADKATLEWRKLPEVYAALDSEYTALLLIAIDDAGHVMNAVANGMDTDASLSKAVSLPEDRRRAILKLLISIGYLRNSDNRYIIGVPVITERDKQMVNEVLKLSREIMAEWLRRNYSNMEKELSGISPMCNDISFSLAFSEVWHYVFGFTTKALAEKNFYANPRMPRNRYEGYVPLVWANSLLKGPGN